MLSIDHYIRSFSQLFEAHKRYSPWDFIIELPAILNRRIDELSNEYNIRNGVAIHKTAMVEEHVVLKGPIIVSAHAFIGAHAYLRGGVFLGEHVVAGPGCEIKTSIVSAHTALAHFNFVGDSLLGSHVNLEAGSVLANHYNEREDKTIYVTINGKVIPIPTVKFGSLVGDHTRIGANAVLSPGTLLEPGAVVNRLELVQQCP
jgi:UDP-N-acetylglucosamine diphosphorylase / glucose-1-phosphate thymidylyltransferase / UDP-N-acetylgalactosamine diphosphorylase / glucosamine-1-phosphate N-acetyltransferase / galactosamine-1-phosphate N-acetyltransferase